jgi:hypothetical protein
MNKRVFRPTATRVIAVVVYIGAPAIMTATGLHGNTSAEPWWIAVAFWLLVFLLPLIWIYRTKLELTPEGVLLCEGAFTLEAPWTSVVALDRTPTREGFLLRDPLPGKGRSRLRFWARANRMVPTGALKDGPQRHHWIAEGRFIPLQAFSNVVRSTEFARLLAERAPHVELLTAARLDELQEADDRNRNIWTFE